MKVVISIFSLHTCIMWITEELLRSIWWRLWDNFLQFFIKIYIVGTHLKRHSVALQMSTRYSFKAPQCGTSNEYPQHMFLWRNKKYYPIIITKYSSLTSPLDTERYIYGILRVSLVLFVGVVIDENLCLWAMIWISVCMVHVLKFWTLYSIISGLSCAFFFLQLFLKMLSGMAKMVTLIRPLLQKQSDLGLHCLHMPFCQKLWCIKF